MVGGDWGWGCERGNDTDLHSGNLYLLKQLCLQLLVVNLDLATVQCLFGLGEGIELYFIFHEGSMNNQIFYYTHSIGKPTRIPKVPKTHPLNHKRIKLVLACDKCQMMIC